MTRDRDRVSVRRELGNRDRRFNSDSGEQQRRGEDAGY
jgi:hypothetical protein